jgi:hypothetical protein
LTFTNGHIALQDIEDRLSQLRFIRSSEEFAHELRRVMEILDRRIDEGLDEVYNSGLRDGDGHEFITCDNCSLTCNGNTRCPCGRDWHEHHPRNKKAQVDWSQVAEAMEED